MIFLHCINLRWRSVDMGHSLPIHSVRVLTNVRCTPNSDHSAAEFVCPLSAISDQILRCSEMTLSAKSGHSSPQRAQFWEVSFYFRDLFRLSDCPTPNMIDQAFNTTVTTKMTQEAANKYMPQLKCSISVTPPAIPSKKVTIKMIAR